MADNVDPVTPEPGHDAAEAETTSADAPLAPEAPAVPAGVTPAQPAPAGPRLRDTVWNFRSMLAVAVASLLIGGAGGAAITAVAGHGDHHERFRIADFRGMGPGMKKGFGYGGGGMPPWEQNGVPSGPGGMMPGGPGFAPGQGTTPASPSAPQSGPTG